MLILVQLIQLLSWLVLQQGVLFHFHGNGFIYLSFSLYNILSNGKKEVVHVLAWIIYKTKNYEILLWLMSISTMQCYIWFVYNMVWSLCKKQFNDLQIDNIATHWDIELDVWTLNRNILNGSSCCYIPLLLPSHNH